MAFITDKNEARRLIYGAAEKGTCTALFCTGSFWNTEAILRGALNFADKHGLATIPVVVAMTSNYSHMAQARRITRCGDDRIGIKAVMDYCRLLCGGSGAPYSRVDVMPHLDHGDPKADRWALTEGAGYFASVMFDAQTYPYEENLAMTRDYVKAMGDKILIEGVFEGLSVGDGQRARQQDDYVEKGVRFVKETGVDFLVADLGTEQQSAGTDSKYLKTRAQSLTTALGKPMLVLHGVSSLTNEQIGTICNDGVIRANMWTRIVRESGQYAARHLIERSNRMAANDFEACEATAYINDNIDKASEIMEGIMGQLGYARLAG
ncbi:MAG: class II fructose-bisphosphate aldolase [Treponema sp.]|jgi:fructose/tagatose bisphosphate aldolase|nr:class II fructose-bisphosphate aldolase [Treponema sp.]